MTTASLPNLTGLDWIERVTLARANSQIAPYYIASIRDEAGLDRSLTATDRAAILEACRRVLMTLDDMAIDSLIDPADEYDDLLFAIGEDEPEGVEEDAFWRDSIAAERAGMGEFQ